MSPDIVVQPISEIARRGNEKNGGNPFGFSDSDGPICGSYPFLLPFSPLFSAMEFWLTFVGGCSITCIPTMGQS
jgi:hypothetical protein